MSGRIRLQDQVESSVSRFLGWFWLTAEERAARSAGPPSFHVLELTRRASVAREVAERTYHPRERLGNGSDAVAAELFRESIHWALLAHAAGSDGGNATAATTTDPTKLLDALDSTLMDRAAGGAKGRAELEASVSRSFREFAELDRAARRNLVERLERASEALLEPLGAPRERMRGIRLRRAVHAFGMLVLVGASLLFVRHCAAVHRKASDLAAGAPWSASSRAADGGCESPRQLCEGGEHYFFQTDVEADPSIIFDLGAERAFSGVEIDNRIDCCTERANPLAVAVSSDMHAWREVARHAKDFTSWHQDFATVRARYVKIHIPLPSAILHLSRVWILP